MLLSKPSLKILWLSKALIKKKKQVTTDAICQPLQQILLYIKRSNVFEMQLFQKPQDSAFRAVQIVLFMLTLILRQIFCSALFQLYFIRASALCHSQNYTPQLESLRATQPSPLVQPELKLMPVLPLLSVCSYLEVCDVLEHIYVKKIKTTVGNPTQLPTFHIKADMKADNGFFFFPGNCSKESLFFSSLHLLPDEMRLPAD